MIWYIVIGFAVAFVLAVAFFVKLGYLKVSFDYSFSFDKED